ncbi:hypothetical protein T440DRAFT_542544 [Plenodomus tracheiphilus IPT5]|uniref:Uncharacterized protein n=1 Tax=Plenodomus tracheiphilus IPT5 TaxID=1408161 RepID=A0A6A7ASZ3_9PLEO|nr:hypothetical protein T440DRAFT_542544 [Plenodomus tracheiphilus IPT5]
MASNLLQCFFEEHPRYPLSDESRRKNDKIPVTPSSKHTELQDPPRLFIRYSVSNYVSRATTWLNSQRALPDARFQISTIVTPEPAPAELANEADVVRVSNDFLVNPVLRAINIKYNTNITVATEVMEDVFRLDLTFNINQDTGNKQTIVVIEFKRLGVIKPAQFHKHEYAQEDKAKETRRLRRLHLNTGLDWGTNAYWMTLHATAYSRATGCEYVALCNYDTLILLRFNDGLASVRLTEVSRGQMRLGLLGFLIAACDFAGIS